jgi:hypothetical protein
MQGENWLLLTRCSLLVTRCWFKTSGLAGWLGATRRNEQQETSNQQRFLILGILGISSAPVAQVDRAMDS